MWTNATLKTAHFLIPKRHQRQVPPEFGPCLSKTELVVPDKDARKVIEMISNKSGTSSKPVGKIFVSEMTELVDVNTFEAEKDLETQNQIFTDVQPRPTRNRLVSLQKHTLARIEKIYKIRKNQKTRHKIRQNY